MITASFTISGQAATVTWEAGRLTGTDQAAAYLQALARSLEGQEVGLPSFAGTMTNHLSDARSFVVLCWLTADDAPQFTITGDEPDLELGDQDFPEGALL